MKEILLWLFNKYEIFDIPYCILNNYERLPEENTGNDIDILMPRKYYKLNEQILNEVSLKYNLTFVKKIIREYAIQYYLVNCLTGKVLHLDFLPFANWRGIIYLTAEQFVKNRKKYKMFYIPSEGYEMVYCWLRYLLWCGIIKDQYMNKLQSIYQKNRLSVNEIIKQIFGERLFNKLIIYLNKYDFYGTIYLRRQLHIYLILKNFKIYKLKLIYNMWISIYKDKSIKRNNSGLFIVLLGCDGSGKTTIIEELKKRILGLFNSNYIMVYHWRPKILKQLRTIFNQKLPEQKINTEPHNKKMHNNIVSTIRFLYYSLDYIIGILMIKRIKRNNGILIFDRYYYDMYIDPKRYRMKISEKLYNIVSRLIPRPDLLLYLDSTVDELMKRKGEVSKEEYEFLLARYREFINNFTDACYIGTNSGIDNTVNECMKTIYHFIQQRDVQIKLVEELCEIK